MWRICCKCLRSFAVLPCVCLCFGDGKGAEGKVEGNLEGRDNTVDNFPVASA